MTDISQIKDQIREKLPRAVEKVIQILENPSTPAAAKIKAFEALANRAGLPALTATMTQSVKTTIDPKELLEERRSLLQEQRMLETERDSLRQELSKKELTTEEGGIGKVLPRPMET
jgi:sugar-specific transcriptional regulator TrmB